MPFHLWITTHTHTHTRAPSGVFVIHTHSPAGGVPRGGQGWRPRSGLAATLPSGATTRPRRNPRPRALRAAAAGLHRGQPGALQGKNMKGVSTPCGVVRRAGWWGVAYVGIMHVVCDWHSSCATCVVGSMCAVVLPPTKVLRHTSPCCVLHCVFV